MASQQLRELVAAMAQNAWLAPGKAIPTVEEMRSLTLDFVNSFPEVPGTSITQVNAGGVPCEFTEPAVPGGDRATVLYLHGGGYVSNSPLTHRRIVSTIALGADVNVLSVDYRLAPEHPFPAGLDDALTAYEWLLASGVEASRVVVAGDSAGGGLAAALAVRLREAGKPLPAGAYLISPWLDMLGTAREAALGSRPIDDFMVSEELEKVLAELYAHGQDLRNPLLSPVYAEMAGLPPVLIHVGEAESLLGDAIAFAERAAQGGADVKVESWPEAFHVFQFHVGALPEADDSLAKASAWISERVARRDFTI